MINVNFWQAADDRRAGRRAAQKSGPAQRVVAKDGLACRKGQPSNLPFSAAQFNVQPVLMCSPLARSLVQPADPPFCAVGQPPENSCFSFGNTALQPFI